ncbi:MAG: hypothetical protein R3362_09205 [Rhodothermales bacterium]|nr:hypothetical protein [Rhodothermales bacterium]
MPRLRSFPLLFAALLVALALTPERAAAQVDEDLAETYVEMARLDQQISQMAGQFQQQLQGQVYQLPEPAREPFIAIFADVLSEASLQERLVEYTEAEADADRLQAAIAWMGDEAVQAMWDAELAVADDPNAQVALQMYAMTGQFGDTEVAPERQALIDRYMEATGTEAKAVDLYLDVIVAASQSMSGMISGDEAPPADSIRAQMRPQLEGMVGNMARGSLLYAYRDLPDEQVAAYVEKAGGPEAQYALGLGMDAMGAAMAGAMREAGRRMAETLQELDAAGEIDLDALRAEAQAEAAEREAAQGEAAGGNARETPEDDG